MASTTLSWEETYRLLGEAPHARAKSLSLPIADTLFLRNHGGATAHAGLLDGAWTTGASAFEPRALVARFLRSSDRAGATAPHPCAVQWSGPPRARVRREVGAKAARAVLEGRGGGGVEQTAVLQAWAGPVPDARDGKRRLFQTVYMRAAPDAAHRIFVRCVEVDEGAGVGAARSAPLALPAALVDLERALELATAQFAAAVEEALETPKASWSVARLALEFVGLPQRLNNDSSTDESTVEPSEPLSSPTTPPPPLACLARVITNEVVARPPASAESALLPPPTPSPSSRPSSATERTSILDLARERRQSRPVWMLDAWSTLAAHLRDDELGDEQQQQQQQGQRRDFSADAALAQRCDDLGAALALRTEWAADLAVRLSEASESRAAMESEVAAATAAVTAATQRADSVEATSGTDAAGLAALRDELGNQLKAHRAQQAQAKTWADALATATHRASDAESRSAELTRALATARGEAAAEAKTAHAKLKGETAAAQEAATLHEREVETLRRELVIARAEMRDAREEHTMSQQMLTAAMAGAEADAEAHAVTRETLEARHAALDEAEQRLAQHASFRGAMDDALQREVDASVALTAKHDALAAALADNDAARAAEAARNKSAALLAEHAHAATERELHARLADLGEIAAEQVDELRRSEAAEIAALRDAHALDRDAALAACRDHFTAELDAATVELSVATAAASDHGAAHDATRTRLTEEVATLVQSLLESKQAHKVHEATSASASSTSAAMITELEAQKASIANERMVWRRKERRAAKKSAEHEQVAAAASEKAKAAVASAAKAEFAANKK